MRLCEKTNPARRFCEACYDFYRSIRGVTHVTGAGVDAALALFDPFLAGEQSTPNRSGVRFNADWHITMAKRKNRAAGSSGAGELVSCPWLFRGERGSISLSEGVQGTGVL